MGRFLIAGTSSRRRSARTATHSPIGSSWRWPPRRGLTFISTIARLGDRLFLLRPSFSVFYFGSCWRMHFNAPGRYRPPELQSPIFAQSLLRFDTARASPLSRRDAAPLPASLPAEQTLGRSLLV